MIKKIIALIGLILPMNVLCQQDSIVVPESQTLDLQFLITEALMNNPEIQASLYQMDVMEARIPQEGGLDDPELKFMQEEMPDFKFNEAMYSRIDLMQTIPFPSKLGTRQTIAGIQREHAHHDHLEKINEVLSKLKSTYYELWLVQQNKVLDQENARLMRQFSTIARMKYGVGTVPQQDVLKAQVELAMIENELIALRQRELSAKSMLISLLNRKERDTLGFAVITEEVVFSARLDTLIAMAMRERPMIVHDSLSIVEGDARLHLAKQEYLPDFRFGLERVTSPASGFKGWSVSAGITLPFAPWTLGKANARVEESNAWINRAKANYITTQNMVRTNITDLYYRVDAGKRQLETFQTVILPQARQSLNASLSGYQTATIDFLMLIDAYRTYVNLTKEYFMTRMTFEQNVSQLEREVGMQNISLSK